MVTDLFGIMKRLIEPLKWESGSCLQMDNDMKEYRPVRKAKDMRACHLVSCWLIQTKAEGTNPS
jgi:hypothetical protein